MANRRMFSKDITTSDLFVDMPQSTQLLYFHLGMEADDDGFIGNAKMLSRAYGANNDDLKLLLAKGLIFQFESGLTVIKDWKVNNNIRKDRYKPTIYQDEFRSLTQSDGGSYELGNQMTTIGIPNGNQTGDTLDTQVRLGKDRLGQDSNIVHSESELKEWFENVWKIYPKKQGKEPAFKSFVKAINSGENINDIWDGLQSYLKQIEFNKTEPRFIKNGSTWFNQKGWQDEYEVGKPELTDINGLAPDEFKEKFGI